MSDARKLVCQVASDGAGVYWMSDLPTWVVSVEPGDGRSMSSCESLELALKLLGVVVERPLVVEDAHGNFVDVILPDL